MQIAEIVLHDNFSENFPPSFNVPSSMEAMEAKQSGVAYSFVCLLPREIMIDNDVHLRAGEKKDSLLVLAHIPAMLKHHSWQQQRG